MAEVGSLPPSIRVGIKSSRLNVGGVLGERSVFSLGHSLQTASRGIEQNHTLLDLSEPYIKQSSQTWTLHGVGAHDGHKDQSQG